LKKKGARSLVLECIQDSRALLLVAGRIGALRYYAYLGEKRKMKMTFLIAG
jgi:hypothetical protein